MDEIRVRFAPSPTGELHIGNVRTAILNWIFAKKHGGKLILRIEDTDLERSTKESETSIFDNLRWLGLDWDEGPDRPGEYGPYRQSERLDVYKKYLELLEKTGKIYPCYKSGEELDAIKKASIERGDSAPFRRKELEATEAEIEQHVANGEEPAWMFEVGKGEIKWLDLLKDEIIFQGENVGDFVIFRSNGSPTYNFVTALDDALMKISHVIRGDDHVSNTPKQILIYQALNFPIPKFCHIPMILGTDRTRLSKRHGATSIQEFRKKGYCPAAMINFLSLLSWSSESGDEILSIERLVEEFDFGRMSKSAAIFDVVKFNWMNGLYFREMPPAVFVDKAMPFLESIQVDAADSLKITEALTLIQNHVEYLAQIPELVEPLFQDVMQPRDGEAINVSSKDSSQKIYWAFLRCLNKNRKLDADVFRNIMKEVQGETGIMGKDLWMPVRVALSGKTHGPDLGKVAEILGKDKVIRFVKDLID